MAPHTQKLINSLENVQIRATKLVDGPGDVGYKERLIRLNLLTLAYRRRRGDMIEIHKHFNSHDQNVIPTSFQPKERLSRKHTFQLYYKRPRDGVRGIHIIHFISEHQNFGTTSASTFKSKVVHADTKNTFKNRLDVFWKDEPIMYDHTASTFKNRLDVFWKDEPIMYAHTASTFKNRLDVFWKDEPIMYDHTASTFKNRLDVFWKDEPIMYAHTASTFKSGSQRIIFHRANLYS